MAGTMSMNPNNPFDSKSDQDPPRKQGSKTWIWILGILGLLGVVGALVCCGGGYALFNVGTGMLAEAYKTQLAGNPVIEEHIGQIESMDMNLTKTAQEGQNSKQEMLAFDITGTKGSGTIMIKQDKSGGDGTGIESAELILSDGSRHPVPLDEFGTSGEFEVDLGDADATMQEFDSAVQEFNSADPGK